MEDFLRNNGIEVDKSLEFLGDMEMYNMTISDFQKDAAKKWETINTCYENEDMNNYSIYVHSLKSDCKYLGFTKLADLSYQHELKSRENDLNYVKENYEELKNEYNKIVKIITEYVEKFNI